MDKNNFNFSNFSPYDNMNFDPNMMNEDIYNNPAFNPMLQYEQAYMYYRYLCMQMEYKIKCKEYEKLCNNNQRDKKIE